MRGFEVQPANSDSFFTAFTQCAFVKAEEERGQWIVYLEASNEAKDQEDEVVVLKALKDAANYYLTHGVISYDHQHKLQKDPVYIIGEPVDVAFTEHRSTLVKGLLYRENKIAQGVWQNLLSNSTRFGASIGGYVLKKSDARTHNVIRKIIWDDTAVTPKPVNDTTLGKVQRIPFAEFAKALVAGCDVNAENFTGGRALTKESMQGVAVKLDEAVMVALFKKFLEKIKEGELKSFEDAKQWIAEQVPSEVLAAEILEFIVNKLTEKG